MAHSNDGDVRPTSIEQFLASPYTRAGFADRRARKPFPADYDLWDRECQHFYEWGRQLAVAKPELRRIVQGNLLNGQARRAAIWCVKSGAFANSVRGDA